MEMSPVVAKNFDEFIKLDLKCYNPTCKKGIYHFSILWNNEIVKSRYGHYCSSVCKDEHMFGLKY